MAVDVTQRERSDIKRYASIFSNIQMLDQSKMIGMDRTKFWLIQGVRNL